MIILSYYIFFTIKLCSPVKFIAYTVMLIRLCAYVTRPNWPNGVHEVTKQC